MPPFMNSVYRLMSAPILLRALRLRPPAIVLILVLLLVPVPDAELELRAPSTRYPLPTTRYSLLFPSVGRPWPIPPCSVPSDSALRQSFSFSFSYSFSRRCPMPSWSFALLRLLATHYPLLTTRYSLLPPPPSPPPLSNPLP